MQMKKNNPIIPRMGVCDPHIHIFQDKAYLYAGHDRSEANDTWLMDDWQIWSSADLVNWQRESDFKPEDTYIGRCERCWAVDAAQRNGRYYYYFSNGNVDIGAAVSDNPGGPFADALGRPLIARDATSSLQYDPTVFIDPDSNLPYLLWGCCEGDGYFIARLNEDMVSLAERPRQVRIDDGYARDDKSFLHKKNGIYYLSWGSYYATSAQVYGPYHFRGTLGISEDHGSFFSWHGQDFYAYTIFDPGYYYRSTGLCYIHYRQNGEMVADQMIAEYGVGAYDGSWNKIQAEWFMEAQNVRKQENVWGGFDIAGIGEESVLRYPGIQGIRGKSKIHFFAASLCGTGVIEIWDEQRNRKIGSCRIGCTNSYDHFGYRMFGCMLEMADADDSLDMRLCFHGEGSEEQELMRVNWFRFT